MSAAAIAVGALAGAAAGLVAEPLVRRLPAGIDDALEQPAWTRALRRPPIMQVVGALLGAAAGWRLGLAGPLVPALLLVALLVPIVFIDIEHRVIPDRLVFPGTAIALVAWALVDPGRLKEHGLAAVIAFAVFLVMAIVYPAGMGLGDVKLALLLGAFLGSAVAPGLFLGFLVSAVPSMAILLKYGRQGGKVGIPFGPFMAAGAFLGLLWGDQLIRWYMG
ncbi:MAG: leader peptidase (prepilin peptidase) / N-methyltransferase [Gaiellaceae bacterium]|nr:leader peptidase (prepilin peptidase) / N-methyltransferase [Gaiellaceae bacterium]